MSSTISRNSALVAQEHGTSHFDNAIIISPFFWNFRDDMWQTTHNVAIQLSHRFPTIFVEPPVAWNAASEQFRAARLVTNLFGRRVRQAAPDLTIFRQRSLPAGRFSIMRTLDHRRNIAALRSRLMRLGFRRTLLWHSFPYWSESWIEAVDHSALAYHCLDYSPREEESRIIARADFVFCVSETLVSKHLRTNPRTHLLPNGVDLDLFNRAQARSVQRPADVPAHEKVIGFVGSINCHLDMELLERMAHALPRNPIVLVGRVLSNETAPSGRHAEALARLKTLPNVHFLGFKPTAELAAYMNAFDVCLVPFLANSFNQECDPLKFYQYLALGKPVVTTAGVPVAQRYAEICYPAASHEDFLRQTAKALTEASSTDLVQRRLAIAEAHSWDRLVGQAIATMESHLAHGPWRDS